MTVRRSVRSVAIRSARLSSVVELYRMTTGIAVGPTRWSSIASPASSSTASTTGASCSTHAVAIDMSIVGGAVRSPVGEVPPVAGLRGGKMGQIRPISRLRSPVLRSSLRGRLGRSRRARDCSVHVSEVSLLGMTKLQEKGEGEGGIRGEGWKRQRCIK